MPPFNPCFCTSLPQGTLIFALLDFVVNTIHAVTLFAQYSAWQIQSCLKDMDEDKHEKKRLKRLYYPDLKIDAYMLVDEPIKRGPEPLKIISGPTISELYIFITLLALSFLIHFVFAGLAWMLFFSVKKKNARLCRVWYMITIFLSLFLVSYTIGFFINGWVTSRGYDAQYRTKEEREKRDYADMTIPKGYIEDNSKEHIFKAVMGVPICDVLTVLYKIYEIVVVFFLEREMKTEGAERGGESKVVPVSMSVSKTQLSITANDTPEDPSPSGQPPLDNSTVNVTEKME